MDPWWFPALGVLAALFAVSQAVQAMIDAGRDIAAPYEAVPDLPEPGPAAWTVRGPSRFGAWGGTFIPMARIIVTADWIGVRQPTAFSGVRHYRVHRADVSTVVVVSGFPMFGSGIGIRGHARTSRLAIYGTNRTAAETELDRLGWPHERRRGRLLRPFA